MTPPRPPLEVLKEELDAFVEVLAEETAALEAGRTDDLARIVEHKDPLAASTSAAWTRAVDWLRAQSSGGPGQGLDLSAESAPLWRDILDTARRAEALNQRNGQLIDAQLRRTKSALEILQSAARPVHLYGADGHMLDLPGHGHPLDQV